MDFGAESMSCQLTDDMKSSLGDRFLDSSTDVPCMIPRFCLKHSFFQRCACDLDTVDMAGITRLSDDDRRRSIGEISSVADAVVDLYDISGFKRYRSWYTMDYDIVHGEDDIGWIFVLSEKR